MTFPVEMNCLTIEKSLQAIYAYVHIDLQRSGKISESLY